jgi:hypothetical protein
VAAQEPADDVAMTQLQAEGAATHIIGNEIWEESLVEAIAAEVEIILNREIPPIVDGRGRAKLRHRLTAEMTSALREVGDSYVSPDGRRYELLRGRLSDTVPSVATPVVEEVLSFETLPLGSSGSRRAVVRWSDGTKGEALRWYDDEVLVCEGDLIGKTADQLRSLHFRRDRDWLQG